HAAESCRCIENDPCHLGVATVDYSLGQRLDVIDLGVEVGVRALRASYCAADTHDAPFRSLERCGEGVREGLDAIQAAREEDDVLGLIEVDADGGSDVHDDLKRLE